MDIKSLIKKKMRHRQEEEGFVFSFGNQRSWAEVVACANPDDLKDDDRPIIRLHRTNTPDEQPFSLNYKTAIALRDLLIQLLPTNPQEEGSILERPFVLGETVRHKNGGPDMTVVGLGPPSEIVWVRCKPINAYGEILRNVPDDVTYFTADKLISKPLET